MIRDKAAPKFIIGDKRDRLKVVKYIGWKPPNNGVNTRYEHRYLTQCICGKYREVAQGYLTRRNGSLKQCVTCAESMKKRANLLKVGKQRKHIITDQKLVKCWKPTSL